MDTRDVFQYNIIICWNMVQFIFPLCPIYKDKVLVIYAIIDFVHFIYQRLWRFLTTDSVLWIYDWLRHYRVKKAPKKKIKIFEVLYDLYFTIIWNIHIILTIYEILVGIDEIFDTFEIQLLDTNQRRGKVRLLHSKQQ